jgi:hypothetical protein
MVTLLMTSRADAATPEYRVLATSKTSTMEKELNEAAQQGFRFLGVSGGDTSALGGGEVVVIMVNDGTPSRREYRLLATSRTGTMQDEIQQAADNGFEYLGQTVFNSAFGGKEVAVILERNPDAPPQRYEYKLLAAERTSTMQKELAEAAEAGFEFLGMTVGKTAWAGTELVCILRRPAH